MPTGMLQAGARLTVRKKDGAEEVLDTAKADVFAANPTGATAPDHCGLIFLNEPCAAALRACCVRALTRALGGSHSAVMRQWLPEYSHRTRPQLQHGSH